MEIKIKPFQVIGIILLVWLCILVYDSMYSVEGNKTMNLVIKTIIFSELPFSYKVINIISYLVGLFLVWVSIGHSVIDLFFDKGEKEKEKEKLLKEFENKWKIKNLDERLKKLKGGTLNGKENRRKELGSRK